MKRDDLVRGPKWRTRTTPASRGRAALVTFAFVTVPGAVLMGGTIWFLLWIGAPAWLAWSLWAVPSVGMAAWALVRPRPAVPTDDDDDAWTTFSILFVIVGEGAPRPAPVRVVAALVFGGPVVWSLTVFGASILAGLF